jgi:hypothetical protein
MSQHEKVMLRILSGASDNNILFADLRSILDRVGFDCRIRGDHFIYTKAGVAEIINIQPNGEKAKAYQVKQVRGIILTYHFGGAERE